MDKLLGLHLLDTVLAVVDAQHFMTVLNAGNAGGGGAASVTGPTTAAGGVGGLDVHDAAGDGGSTPTPHPDYAPPYLGLTARDGDSFPGAESGWNTPHSDAAIAGVEAGLSTSSLAGSRRGTAGMDDMSSMTAGGGATADASPPGPRGAPQDSMRAAISHGRVPSRRASAPDLTRTTAALGGNAHSLLQVVSQLPTFAEYAAAWLDMERDITVEPVSQAAAAAEAINVHAGDARGAASASTAGGAGLTALRASGASAVHLPSMSQAVEGVSGSLRRLDVVSPVTDDGSSPVLSGGDAGHAAGSVSVMSPAVPLARARSHGTGLQASSGGVGGGPSATNLTKLAILQRAGARLGGGEAFTGIAGATASSSPLVAPSGAALRGAGAGGSHIDTITAVFAICWHPAWRTCQRGLRWIRRSRRPAWERLSRQMRSTTMSGCPRPWCCRHLQVLEAPSRPPPQPRQLR